MLDVLWLWKLDTTQGEGQDGYECIAEVTAMTSQSLGKNGSEDTRGRAADRKQNSTGRLEALRMKIWYSLQTSGQKMDQ